MSFTDKDSEAYRKVVGRIEEVILESKGESDFDEGLANLEKIAHKEGISIYDIIIRRTLTVVAEDEAREWMKKKSTGT